MVVLLDLWEACEAERDAACTTNTEHWDEAEQDDAKCFGQNHARACPVAIARATVAAVLAKGLP